MTSISFPLAFIAGLLSSLSPCVLSLVPVYLTYLSGSTLSGDGPSSRWKVSSHALVFVTGFTMVFVVLFGLPTTVLSTALQRYSLWITRVGGVILILFGLHTMRAITIPVLDITRRLDVGRGVKPSYVRSGLVGVTFATGWTPCVGPLLGTVMTLTFTEPSRGLALTFVYAMGIATPFLVVALLLTRAVDWLKRFSGHLRTVETASSLLMVGLGILLLTGLFSLLNSFLARITPEWLVQYL